MAPGKFNPTWLPKKSEQSKAYNRYARNKSSTAFYASEDWQRLRRLVLLEANYLCEICKRRPATQVHHIKSLEEYPQLGLERTNLQALCTTCHGMVRHN